MSPRINTDHTRESIMDRLKNRVIRPSYDDDESDLEPEVSSFLPQAGEDDDDEMSTLLFGSLSSAQQKMAQELKRGQTTLVAAEDAASNGRRPRHEHKLHKPKRSKHAPAELSSKQRVSTVREIEGLGTKYKDSSLYRDIRFDPAYGKADLEQIRKNYAFLDEYREKELGQMKLMLKDKKTSQMLSHRDREDLEYKVQSLKSRLDTMKNRDLEAKILATHKREQLQKFKDGLQANPYFLKKSEKRKLIQKAKFDTMKSSQREKVMERKRKRRLGKEFRELEFNQHK